jgi:HAD superfamily hydrolase (TIGR01509 family)
VDRQGRAAATRAVIFDMDGVLADSGACHRKAWSALLDELQVPEPPEVWRLTIGRPSHEAVSVLLGRELPEAEARALSRRKQSLYLDIAAAGVPAVPGAPGFVEELRRRQVPRAVATSARQSDMRHVLGGLGLIESFDAIITAEHVRRGKPDPEVYLLAAQAMGMTAPQCLVFEDSLVGVQSASGAGMRVIGVATSHTEAELLQAGAERVLINFEGCGWPL